MSAFFNLRTVTTTDTSTLEDIAATLSRNYPHLTINSVPKTRTEWIVVHRPDMIIFSPDHPPTCDPHMTLTMDSDKVLYDNDKQSDKFEVPVSFTNPFTGQPIYQLICPSHQVSVCCVCLCVNPFILYM